MSPSTAWAFAGMVRPAKPTSTKAMRKNDLFTVSPLTFRRRCGYGAAGGYSSGGLPTTVATIVLKTLTLGKTLRADKSNAAERKRIEDTYHIFAGNFLRARATFYLAAASRTMPKTRSRGRKVKIEKHLTRRPQSYLGAEKARKEGWIAFESERSN